MYFATMKIMMVGALMTGTAVSATAQERGTVEFGAFGNYSFYDEQLRVDDGFGGGLRVGAFIFPRLSVEFDVGRKQSERPLGLQDVAVEGFAWRLTAVPVIMGPLSVLVGAGLAHTDFDAPALSEMDGVQGLLGLKYAIGSRAALRVEGVVDFNGEGARTDTDDNPVNAAIQLGLSLYRHPAGAQVISRSEQVLAAPPAPAAPGPAAPAPAARPAPRVDELSICVVEPGGRLSNTTAYYRHATRDTVVTVRGDSVPVRTLVEDVVVASDVDWYRTGRSLVLDTDGVRRAEFLATGSARVIAPADLVYIGSRNGLPVYAARTDVARVRNQWEDLLEARAEDDLAEILKEQRDLREAFSDVDVLYVPIQPLGCVFQALDRQEDVRKGDR